MEEKIIAPTISYKAKERIIKLNYDKGALLEIITTAQQSYWKTEKIMKHDVKMSNEYQEFRNQLLEQVKNDDITLSGAEELSKEFIDNIYKENEISWLTLKFFVNCDTKILRALSEITWKEFTELDNE